MDRLRDDLWKNHPQIRIEDFELYNVEIFNRCENSQDVLLAIQSWSSIHPLMRMIPVEWNYSIPFGLLYAKEPSEKVRKILKGIKKAVEL